MTPTYPKLQPSHIAGLYKAKMKMFNKRKEVEYYEIGVFDKDRNPIDFVSTYRILHLEYLGHVDFDVYVREVDKDRVTYICSRSKLKAYDSQETVVSSLICSKVK